ncbi:MAG: hypothetical protein HYR60_05405 [Acidobacteria bacterium]|nr:hypothetical protein [Acidobacteriota bacterium]
MLATVTIPAGTPLGLSLLRHDEADPAISTASEHGIEVLLLGTPCGAADARTLLDRYLRTGAASFSELHGAWACVVADRRGAGIFLARDSFGFVPLFYCVSGETLYCSNGLHTLLKQVPVSFHIDPAGLLRYYLFRFVVPPLTLYKEIQQPAPGNHVLLRADRVSVARHTRIPKGIRRTQRWQQIEDSLRGSIFHAVREELRSASRPAIALSGGLDSAVVAAALPKDGPPVRAVTLRRIGSGEDQGLATLCRSSRSELISFDFEEREFALLPHFHLALQEPVCVLPLFYLYLLLRRTVGMTDRILLGEGGDELFLGYRHQMFMLRRYVQRQTEGCHELPALRRELLTWRLGHVAAVTGWEPPEEVVEQALACLPKEPHSGELNDMVDATVEQELTCFPYFLAGTRLGAPFGVDVRCPLLNPVVVAAAFALPWDTLITPGAFDGFTKNVLRQAFQRDIPEAILSRPKEGFGENWHGFRGFAELLTPFSGRALERLRAAGLKVTTASNPPAARESGEAADLFWHNVFLGIWLDTNDSDAAARLEGSIGQSLAGVAQ